MTIQAKVDVEDLIGALGLPSNCSINQRVPKKLLIENAAATAGDRRQINQGIEEIYWIAALKANSIGVSEYRDDKREYLEIAVLEVKLRLIDAKTPKTTRLTELIHRAVPYPVILLMQLGGDTELSLSHKRWSQNETGKVVVDGNMTKVTISGSSQSADGPLGNMSTLVPDEFMRSLAMKGVPQATLYSLYQGWIDSVEALQAARITGSFSRAFSPERAALRSRALIEYRQVEEEIVRLRALASKEIQLAKRVELNLALKKFLGQLNAIRDQL